MKIKKFKAGTIKEALLLVKAELGPQAVILNTKKMGGGLFGGEKYEVTAALDENSYAKPGDLKTETEIETETEEKAKRVTTYSPRKLKEGSTRGATTVIDRVRRENVPAEGLAYDHFAPPSLESEGFESLRQDLDKMRSAVYSMAEKGAPAEAENLPAGLKAVRETLEQNEVSPAQITALLSQMKKDHTPEQQQSDLWMRRSLFRRVEAGMAVSGPIKKGEGRARRIALVGPTGVGKTTTIAKLAAHLKLKEKLNVALIAADNYRMAAIEQIQQFAQIAGIPLEVVFSDAEMHQALVKFASYDIVFIDTAGRSQRNIEHMNDLRRTLMAADADEVHLTVSITTKMRDLRLIEKKYAEVGYNRLIFTKLDETISYGTLYNLVRESGKPVSYVSTGQGIPDDLNVGTTSALANLIVGGGAS
jgi:flagellar biosynthesis protein FlhF